MTDKEIVIGVDPEKQIVTIGPFIMQIKHPVFWKYFGYGTVVAGLIIGAYAALGG